MRRLSVSVTNRSVYRSDELAALFRAALKAHNLPSRSYRLEALPAYHSRMSDGNALVAHGRAVLGGSNVWMLCEAPLEGETHMETHRFVRWCWTLDHEVLHLKGFKDGKDMDWHARKGAAACPGGTVPTVPMPPTWAMGFEALSVRPAKPTPSKDEVRERKIAHAEEMLRRAQSRVKRAESLAARWRRKLAGLRRAKLRLAASKG